MRWGPASEALTDSEVRSFKLGHTVAHDRNAALFPDPLTLRGVPWAGSGIYRVGEVLCESYWLPDLSPQMVCPRYACRRQLQRLAEAGFVLRTDFELGFRLENVESNSIDIFNGHDANNPILVDQCEKFLFETYHLSEVGVISNCIYPPNKFMLKTKSLEGIKAVDDAFVMKQGIKEIAVRNGLIANFMVMRDTGSPTHKPNFCHSLFTLDGLCAFGEENGINPTSTVGRYWLGGLWSHSRALCALCAPTVNCYRRLNTVSKAPNTKTWCSDFFGKSSSSNSVIIEGRITGLANPYLVIAAIAAAGLDGITRQLECPLRAGQLQPRSLQEAIDALLDDDVLVEILGRELVDLFVEMKREHECSKFKEFYFKVNDEQELTSERDLYAKWLWNIMWYNVILHWGLVTQIYGSLKWVIVGLGNGLSPVRGQQTKLMLTWC